jgi:transposase-like protein
LRCRYTPDEKLKAVRLRLEEGFSLRMVSQELGVSKSSLEHWTRAYNLGGQAGLQPAAPAKGMTIESIMRWITLVILHSSPAA